MLQNKQKHVVILFCVFTFIYVSLSLYGVVDNYSSVPYWDMWDGYVNFALNILDKNWSMLWSFHNEHRIFLSRLLFLLDMFVFNGASVFLLVSNFLLNAALAFVFCMILNELLGDQQNKYCKKIMYCIIISLLYSWLASDNLIYPFQNQFFFAQLFPLLAFYTLHKSNIAKNCHKLLLFILACFLGVLSLGSMANGTITLPCMVMLAFFLRIGLKRIILLAFLSIVSMFFYTRDMHTDGISNFFKKDILEHIWYFFKYVLTCLGSVVPQNRFTVIIQQFLGASFCILFFMKLYNYKNFIHKSSIELSMICYVLYTILSIMFVSIGRYDVNMHVTSRYITVILASWAGMLILYAPWLQQKMLQYKFFIPTMFLLCVCMIYFPQTRVFKHKKHNDFFEHKISMIALKLGIYDVSQLNFIYPHADRVMELAKKSFQQKLPIFSRYFLKDTQLLINEEKENIFTKKECIGKIDSIFEVESNNPYKKVVGWIFNFNTKETPEIVHILNFEHTVIGYALVGKYMPEMKEKVDQHAKYVGLEGYMLKDKVDKGVILLSKNPDCFLKINENDLPLFEIQLLKDIDSKDIVSTNVIINNNGWFGSDYQKSHINGIKILSTLVHSDADVGSIFLKIKRGDTFYYRSGPVVSKQFMRINEPNFILEKELPLSDKWHVLKFTNKYLPNNFTIELVDAGVDWGEWSAIGLRGED